MYTRKQLVKYKYFEKIMEEKEPEELLDALTGLISRAYIIDFVKSLIEENTPFTYAILDLDNFKFINDTYGHNVGDGVLKGIASDLYAYLGDYGIAGRFGGDEFLIVNLRDRTYDEKKAFYRGMYDESKVLRKMEMVGEYQLFVTGTVGCATFPDDATDYDGLFALIDKTLYRGKTKGRNCYIIYVESKHKNIEVKQLKGRGLYNIFHGMSEQFDSTPDLYGKMRAIYSMLHDDIHITDMYYVSEERELKSVNDTEHTIGNVSDIDAIIKDDMYATNRIDELKTQCPQFYAVLNDHNIETVLVMRIGMGPLTYGYLLCAEPGSLRIWQEDECAIMFSLSRMLAGYIRGARLTLS